jgi:hypothetical protein
MKTILAIYLLAVIQGSGVFAAPPDDRSAQTIEGRSVREWYDIRVGRVGASEDDWRRAEQVFSDIPWTNQSAVRALYEILLEGDRESGIGVAGYLARNYGTNVHGLLLQTATNTCAAVREGAMCGLAYQPVCIESMPLAVEALTDPDPACRLAGQTILNCLPVKARNKAVAALTPSLTGDDEPVRQAVLTVLHGYSRGVDVDATLPVLEVAWAKTSDKRNAAMAILRVASTNAIAFFLGRLSGSREDAIAAIYGLNWLAEDHKDEVLACSAQLRAALRHPDLEVRAEMAILGQKLWGADEDLWPALLDALRSTQRQRVAGLVAQYPQHADRIVPALMVLLDDPDFSIRITAAHALGDFGTSAKPALPKLKLLLRDAKRKAAQDRIPWTHPVLRLLDELLFRDYDVGEDVRRQIRRIEGKYKGDYEEWKTRKKGLT